VPLEWQAGAVADQIDYVELPSQDLAGSKAFYASAFGWSFQDFGPSYAGLADAGLDGGIAADDAKASSVPLVILRSDDLEGSLERVRAAGGEITVPIFEFPGGRRFHFRDPAGNELGVWAE
jgi:predicted enzyme related to lactoylglutathione lyase